MSFRSALPALLWALSASLCAAQSATELVLEGFRLAQRGEIVPARQSFDHGLARAKEEKNPLAEAEAHRGLGQLLNRQAQYAAAREELEQALALHQALSYRVGIGKASNALAFSAWGMGDMKQAGDLWRKALVEFEAVGELSEKATLLYNLLFVATARDEQERLIQQGLALARQLGNQRLEGQFLHQWGGYYRETGDFAAALEKLEQAVRLLDRADTPRELAEALTALGRLYRTHGHPERAIEFYRRALKIQEQTGDRYGQIQSINIIGAAYDSMGEPKLALEHYQRALALARQTGSPRLRNGQLENVAGALIKLGEYGRAIEILEEALRQGPRWEARAYGHLSRAYIGLGRYPLALEAAEKSVESARKTEDAEFQTVALSQRARVKQRLGQTDEALADVDAALQAVEQFRARLVPTDFMKRGFADQYQDLFGLSIELLYQSGRHDRAFEVAEQARARAFLDLLATREVQARPADRTELAALRELETNLRAKGLNPAEPASAASYPLLLRGADPEVASLWKQWRSADAELRSLVSAAPLSVKAMAASAARLRSTVLAYWVGPEATFAWVVRPGGAVRSVRVGVPRGQLEKLIRHTAATPGSSQGVPGRGGDVLLLDDAQKQAWRELYRLLIRPVRRLLPGASGSRLTIVPHGPLFQVSFAALLGETGRYLAEDYTLHYAPAGAVLEFTGKKKQRLAGRPTRYLLVADPSGPPTLPNGKPLPPLPGSRREAKAIARLLPPEAVTLLEGSKARKENVRVLARDKTVIHFATHGVVRNDQPFDSFLALSEGRLTAQEIYELDLDADLVVLSACRTGLGRISGDGIVGLTRAFFYAGTPSVMATLWDVADEPTFMLVSEFYRSLHRLRDKSRALRAAQLQLLRALRNGEVTISTPAGTLVLPEHPVFWAGFVLLGEP